MTAEIELNVNGRQRHVTTPPDRRLLDVLREDLHLTGTKYGCGEGECGACTVLVDGRAVRSCTIEIRAIRGKKIRTIEDLASDGRLHPVQQAFVDEGAMQCGYCASGMIMTAVAFLQKHPDPSPEETVEAMNGNLCRCCGYPALLAAVRRAATLSKESRS